MNKTKKVTVVLVMAMLTAVIIHASQVSARVTAEKLFKRQETQSNLGSVTTADALVRVLNAANVPGGIVVVSHCDEPIRYPVRLTDSSLRDKLNSIVLADHQYVWQEENGVINLVYRNDNPPFLNLHIAHFKAENVKTVYEALDLLLRTPEAQEGMLKLSLGPQLLRGGIGYYGLPASNKSKDNQKFTVNCANVTVREALNAIARAHGRGVWAYSQAYCKRGNFFSIDFLAQ
ncbi:MAG: hypothetical protein ABR577_13980 [Pyrinomonadaceae bacterium]